MDGRCGTERRCCPHRHNWKRPWKPWPPLSNALPDASASIRLSLTITRVFPRPVWEDGAQIAAHQSRRQGSSLSRRGSYSWAHFRERSPENSGVHLAGVFLISALSRRRMDAGTLPQLRSAHAGFRRMPLPGPAPHRKRRSYRSRLLARSRAPHRRGSISRGQFQHRRFSASFGFVVRPIARPGRRSVELPRQSRVKRRKTTSAPQS